jgi:hypothetical protein
MFLRQWHSLRRTWFIQQQVVLVVVIQKKTDEDIRNVCNAVHGRVYFSLKKDNAVEQTNGIMRKVAMSQKSEFLTHA